MKEKLLFLLEELKENYTDTLLNDTLECIRGEICLKELFEDRDKLKIAINGQSDKFYDELAFDFVVDLNEVPEMYFTIWEPLIEIFNEQTKKYFYSSAIDLANNSDATDYINGLMEFENDNYAMAHFYFNRIDSYVAYYFIAICYFETSNYENSIKQNLLFLKHLDNLIAEQKEIDLANEEGILIAKWNVFNDLGYAYNRIYEFDKALDNYNNSLMIFNLKDAYEIRHTIKFNNNLDDFTIFANNYLLSLERTGKYETCLEVIDFLISKYPNDTSYRRKREKLLDQKNKQDDFDYIFTQVFKPKKPFNITSFQEAKLISKEKILEDLILEQIKYGFHVFDKPLEIFHDERIYGRQYRIIESNGYLDLLLIDKSKDQLYVVELKRNRVGIEVVAQIESYINALSKELNRNIKGIICIHKSNPKLTEMVREKEDIELYTYNFDFQKEA